MGLWLRWIRITAKEVDAAPGVEAHRAHVETLRAEARLRFAAALSHGDGFVEIFEARDKLEARSIAEASPLVERGLAAWTLRELHEVDAPPE